MSQSNLTLPTRTEAEARAERAKHTPGPHRYRLGTGSYSHYVVDAPPDAKGLRSVLAIAIEKEADAALFAAASDLLAALKIARVQLGEHKDGMGAAHYHACNIADAAIAKAEGQDEKDREIRERLKDEIRNQGTC